MMSQAGRTPDRDAEKVVSPSRPIRAPQRELENSWLRSLFMRVRRGLAHVLNFFPLHCLCFKAAYAHFRPRPDLGRAAGVD